VKAFIDKLALKLNCTKKQAKTTVDTFTSLLTSEVANREGFSIPNLGSFNVSSLKRTSSIGGQDYKIDSKVIHFKSSKSFKDKVKAS